VYNGNLYAGGQFVAVGGTLQVNNIAQWNGSDWVALTDPQGTGTTLSGSPTGGAVFDLTVYNNTLVAGGSDPIPDLVRPGLIPGGPGRCGQPRQVGDLRGSHPSHGLRPDPVL
jgi:hypothetical protein